MENQLEILTKILDTNKTLPYTDTEITHKTVLDELASVQSKNLELVAATTKYAKLLSLRNTTINQLENLILINIEQRESKEKVDASERAVHLKQLEKRNNEKADLRKLLKIVDSCYNTPSKTIYFYNADGELVRSYKLNVLRNFIKGNKVAPNILDIVGLHQKINVENRLEHFIEVYLNYLQVNPTFEIL